ncbi:MAG: TetR/AcrR family transcriptional regulator [Bacteroidales bacterium]|jgi:AcrR family transcriptional regulator|nr:TetR/AcrR family transcriptional regulator [Bacteroidales bacterium]
MNTDRQTEILQVSLELISEKGIQGLTIKNIASKIGTSEPAIYRHFENKIEILLKILDSFKKLSEDVIKEELSRKASSIEKISNIYRKHFEEFSRNPSLVAVIFSEEIFANETILIDRISGIMKENEKIIISIIETGQSENEIKANMPAAMLSVVIMGSLRLFVKKWQFSGYDFVLAEKGEMLIQTITNLLKTEK